MQNRTCKHCHGEETQLKTEQGEPITWRNASGEMDTWFCPKCSWGAGGRSE